MEDKPVTINSKPEPIDVPKEPDMRGLIEEHDQPTEPINTELATHPQSKTVAGSAELPTVQLGGNSDLESNRITVTPLNGGVDVLGRQNKE